MRRLKSLPICLALTSALLLAPARAAVAQLKPAVVVSVTSVSEMMNDIQYLARAAGAPEMAGLVTLLTAQYTQFLDANKPGGVYVVFSGVNEPVAIGFLPVKDQDALLAKLAEQIGQPEDAGNGIQKINGPQPMFLKAANGYTFVSNADANLANLPQDPAALLGGLDKSYNLAVQINPQSIPPELRKMAISQMKSSFEMQLEQQEQPEGVDAELQKKLARNSMDQMAKLIDDSERILIGWAVDADGSSTYLDAQITAGEGTELAQQFALVQDTRTRFYGFQRSDAAATMTFSTKMSESDKQQLQAMLETMHKKAAEEIDKDANLPDEQAKAAVKEVLDALMDVVKDTVEQGELDAGAALVLAGTELKFAAGGRVADGAKVAAAFQKLVALAENEPDFPEVKLNAEKYQNVDFHTLSAPVPETEADARKIFGERLNMVLGTGPQSVYFAFGEGASDMLKQVIDDSAQNADKVVSPSQITVALTPILKFGANFQQENPALTQAIQALEQAGQKDHLLIEVTPIQRGVAYRIEVEEGVLQAIGGAVKAAQSGAPGGGGF